MAEWIIDGWVLLYASLMIIYNLMIVVVRTKKEMPDAEDSEVFEAICNNYVRYEGTVVWSCSTLVFLSIYGMWYLWG